MTDPTDAQTPLEGSAAAPGATQTPPGYATTPDAPTAPQDGSQSPPEADPDDAAQEDAETFPRTYVEKLRREAAGLRDRLREAEGAQERADALSRRLHAALLAQDGRLIDPDALPFDATHLDSPDALEAAVSTLLARKPYLAAHRFPSTLPQGATGTPAASFSLADALRSNA